MKRLALIGQDAPLALEQCLRRHGYSCLRAPAEPRLPRPVRGHPDLSVFFAPDALYTTADYAARASAELRALCRSLGLPLRLVTGRVGDRYPQDVLLDALAVGGRLFCLPQATAPELTARPDLRVIPVRQGYAKCAALPVADQAIVSADPSILQAAEREGLPICRIEPGGVRLCGYSTGLIGGAASYAPYRPADMVFFCGSLSTHPSGAEIQRLLTAHGLAVTELTDMPLTDIGTIFLLEA